MQKTASTMEAARPRSRVVFTLATAAVAFASTALAGTPEQQCQDGRYRAAATYTSCQQKTLAKYFATGDLNKLDAAVLKCRLKYGTVWDRLAAQASGSGASCDAVRFVNTGSTVTDNLTALQWEKKTSLDGIANLADPHDADNLYTWTATGTAADGSVYASFLAALNGSCFAGHCDWRLPTITELQTLVDQTRGNCGGTSGACIDPIFGPAEVSGHWSATTFASFPPNGWLVDFDDGAVDFDLKNVGTSVRAVRGGT